MAVEIVPAGELAIHRGDPVRATDGQVGHVGEFIVDSDSGYISHMVLQKGHLWGKREVTLELSLINKVEDGVIYLNVDKDGVEQASGSEGETALSPIVGGAAVCS